MPSLTQKLDSDLKEAMRAKDPTQLSALRMLKTSIKNLEVSKKNTPATDPEVIGLINKAIKQRQESITQYEKAGRNEQASQEKAEVKVLESYLPKQMDEAALEKLAREVVEGNALSAKKDFGKAMKLMQEKVAGQADNRRVSAVLNKFLK